MAQGFTFPDRARQSKEVTDAYQQYCGNIVKYWDRFLVLIREEYEAMKDDAARQGKSLSREGLVCRLAHRTFDKSLCKRLDPQHPERVKDAFSYIFRHPLVEERKDGYVKGISLISEFNFDPKKWVISMDVNVKSIFRHYLRDKLTVEYDPLLKDSFKNKVTAALYLKGCALSSEVDGFFEFDEDQIRVFLSYDVITDIEHLEELCITDIHDAPCIKASGYRFNDLKSDIIEKALEEIEGAFRAGLCKFYLRLEVQTITIPRQGRGGMKKDHILRFYIEQDADALEPVKALTKSVKAVDDRIQDLFPETNETKEKLERIRKSFVEIIEAGRGTHAKQYQKMIISDIKSRLREQPDLPDAVLAWIDYLRWHVAREGLTASDLARMMQDSLMKKLNLVYWSRNGVKRREQLRYKWDGTASVQFPPEKAVDGNTGADFFKEVSTDLEWRQGVILKYALTDPMLDYVFTEFFGYSRNRTFKDAEDVRQKFLHWMDGEAGKIAVINYENNKEGITQMSQDYETVTITATAAEGRINSQAERVKLMRRQRSNKGTL